MDDLYWFLPEDKAKAAFPVLDVDGDGKVTMADMRDAVVSIYKERKNLALTLKVGLNQQQHACKNAVILSCACTLSGCGCAAQVVFGVAQDTKGVVGKLENIFAVMIHTIFAVAYLTIFQARTCSP